MSARLAIASQIVERAAELALSHFNRRDEISVSSKRVQDFVSEADVAVEQFIREQLQLHFPDDAVVGEEMGGQLGDSACWVIDPIDGTSNFLRGSPLCVARAGRTASTGDWCRIKYKFCLWATALMTN